MKEPIAKKVDKEIIQHGFKRNDPFFWLRDENWKNIVEGEIKFSNPEVFSYIQEENNYKDFKMEGSKEVEKQFYDEILSRIKEDSVSYPVPKGGFEYYSREEKGKNYSILCRKKALEGADEEIYFDINKEAEGKDLYIFGPSQTNKKNNYFAYFYNLTGSLEKTLRVRDLSSGKDLSWEIPGCTGSFEWIDDESLYYIERDENSRGKNLYHLNIKEGPSNKRLVFTKPEENTDMFMWLSKTEDGEFFSIYLNSGATQVIYLAKKGEDNFSFFSKEENDISHALEHHKGSFYLLTNIDGAKNFKVMTCSALKPELWGKENWKELVAEKENKCLNEIYIYNKYLILLRKNNEMALNELVVYEIGKEEENIVKIPSSVYSLSFHGNWNHLSTKVRIGLNTPLNSLQTYELNLESLELDLLHEKEVPNYNSENYVLKREFAKARDGKLIPLTIVHKKDLSLDGRNKSFVYAYGSYGYGMPAYFSSSVFSLIDRGFVYCIAHIRGGDDKGHEWYLDGKMKKKMNTFNDFIDSCEFLVKEKYTSEGLISINGGSAGGLLMGAVTNMRPELFGAVIADVAFVDVINTISDGSLPLTPPEWEEWGNPIENKEDFEYIMKYSPYDNVERKAYPPMLYNSGISDEQVTYWEPTKMVAKLRDMKTDDNLLLLNMKMHAGHSGASKKYEWIEELAFNYSFIMKVMA